MMETSPPVPRAPVSGRHRLLFLLTAVLTGVLVASGALVCVTDASSGCPDWPGCYGRLVPPLRLKSVIEWSHRLVAALTLPLLLWTVVVGWRRYPHLRWLRWTPLLSVVTLLSVVAFGAAAVLWGLSPVLAALDLGSALTTLALVVTAAAVAAAHHRRPDLGDRIRYPDGSARLGPWTLILLFVVLVSGVLVAEPGSVVRCVSLPRWESPASGGRPWLSMARLVVGAVAAGMSIGLALVQWRRHRTQSLCLLGLLTAEIAVGAWLSARGLTDVSLVIYSVLAVALWAVLVSLVVSVGLDSARTEELRPGTRTRG
jgi:heme A synthase